MGVVTKLILQAQIGPYWNVPFSLHLKRKEKKKDKKTKRKQKKRVQMVKIILKQIFSGYCWIVLAHILHYKNDTPNLQC